MSVYDKLLKKIQGYDNSIIAYSGGVDSSLLVLISHLAGIRFLPVTVVSEVITSEEVKDAKTLTNSIGISHHLEDIKILQYDNFKKNPKNRCFYCKDIIMKRLKVIARDGGFRYILEGTNFDDLNDWRPGIDAIKQFNDVKSPFVELSITKSDIRDTLRNLDFSIWNKPPSPCLATRIYYDTEITRDLLDMVNNAEVLIRKNGFTDVRVRTDGTNALIEVNTDQTILMLGTDLGKKIEKDVLSLGFKTVNIAKEGYISGRLNKI